MMETQKTLLGSMVTFLIRARFVILFVGIVAMFAAWPVARRLKFDRKIESLYADTDPHIKDYLESKSLFGGDEFVIVAYSEPNLFVPGSLDDDPKLETDAKHRIEKFANRLNAIKGVQGQRTQQLAATLEFPYKRRDVVRLVEGVLVGDDRQATAIVLRLEAESQTGVPPRGETFDDILETAGKHNPPASVVGEPLQIHYMFRYVEEDGSVLFWVSLGLLGTVLFVFFARPTVTQDARRWLSFVVRIVQWVGLPLLVVVATIVWTEAVLVLSQTKLSMVSSMLNSMVTIIAIATVTHLTVHFRELRRTHNRADAFRQTLVEVLPAVLLTCATTAVGFGALWISSSITPVQSFGKMMCLASAFVFVATIAILPGGILIGRFSTDPLDAPAEKWLVRFLHKLNDWIERRPVLLSLAAVLMVVISAAGLLQLEVETDFSKNFRESSPLVKGLNFVETELGGAGTWEVNFPAPKKLTDDYLNRVNLLADALRNINADNKDAPRLTKVLAITDGLDLVPKQIKLPLFGVQQLGIGRRLQLLHVLQPDFESTLYNRAEGRMRILLRARERQTSASKLSLIDEAERIAQKSFPRAKATGLFVLLAFLIESLLGDQLVSFALAATGICAMMTVAFRSFKIGLISLVPNIFPIVLVIGAMGWIDMPVNIATAMIASVSMGLTVDSTIHYISAFRRARRRGLSVNDALRECHRGVGRALVFANIALIIGFAVLSLSQFIPLVYFGLLLSLAMIGGLIGDLVLLPLLLQWVEGRPSGHKGKENIEHRTRNFE